jgi:hypothetical protein
MGDPHVTGPGPPVVPGGGEGPEDVPLSPIPPLEQYLAAVRVAVKILEKMDRTIAVMEKELADRGPDSSTAGGAKSDTPDSQDQILRVRLEAIRSDLRVLAELLQPLVGPFAVAEAPAFAGAWGEPSFGGAGGGGPSRPSVPLVSTLPPHSQPSAAPQPSAASAALKKAREGLGTVTASLEKARDALERRE